MATHLYEIALIGTFDTSVEVVNRWNYRGDVNAVAGGDAAALIKAMGFDATGGVFPVGKIGAALAALTSNVVIWRQVLSRNVYDPTDFLDLPLNPSVAGIQTGEALSPINAYGLRSNRTRLDVGRGYKRFVGPTEATVTAKGVLDGATITALNSVADLMSDIITFSDGTLTDSFTPVVVKKLKYTTPRDRIAYKYYPTEAEQLSNLAVGVTWESYPNIRSQVSRQYGRGA